MNEPEIFTNIGVLLVLYLTFSVANFLLRFLLKSHAVLLNCFTCNVSGICCHNWWEPTTAEALTSITGIS